MREINPYDPPRKLSVGRFIFYAVATAIIIFLVTVLFNVILSRKDGEPPSVFGYSVFIVTSNSMEPVMSPGSALLVEKVDHQKLNVDDVITYEKGYSSEGKLLVDTKRIVEILEEDGERSYRLKGDQSDPADEGVVCRSDQVLGKAISSLPGVGSFFAFVKTPIGLVACIALPLLILLTFEVVNLVRLSRKPSRGDESEKDEEEPEELGPLAAAVKRKKEQSALQSDTLELFATNVSSFVEEDVSFPESIPPMKPILKQELPIEPEPPSLQEPPSFFEGLSSTLLESVQVPLETVQAPVEAVSVPLEPASIPLASPRISAEPTVPSRPVREPWQPITPPSPKGHADLYGVSIPLSEAEQSVASSSVPAPVLSGSAGESPVWPKAPGAVPDAYADGQPDTGAVNLADADGLQASNFAAEVSGQGKNRFRIDGIDVKVRPDAINLALGGDEQPRDISIVITKDCTNVVVGSGNNEVNFSLYRDATEDAQKVVIQKKNRKNEP